MVSNEFVYNITTISFLREIKGLKIVCGVPLHEKDLVADHRDELRTNHIETTLEYFVVMGIFALFTFSLSAVGPKKKQEGIAQLVFDRINSQNLVLNIKISNDLASSIKDLLNASKSNIRLVTDSFVAPLRAIDIETDIQIMKPKSLLLIDLQKTLEKHSCLVIIKESLSILANNKTVFIDQSLVLPKVFRFRCIRLFHVVNIII